MQSLRRRCAVCLGPSILVILSGNDSGILERPVDFVALAVIALVVACVVSSKEW